MARHIRLELVCLSSSVYVLQEHCNDQNILQNSFSSLKDDTFNELERKKEKKNMFISHHLVESCVFVQDAHVS